jgi:flagellar biosynthesis chaperone FliJ
MDCMADVWYIACLMTTGKGRGAIEKLVRLREHEEKEARVRVADGVRLVEELAERLGAARRELDASLGKVKEARSRLRRGMGRGLRGLDIAAAMHHLDALEARCGACRRRADDAARALAGAERGLEEARQRLKEKKAGRMAAEKLLARRRSEQAAEAERKEE